MKYIPLEKYMAMVAPFAGAIFIVLGGVMCLFGRGFHRVFIAVLAGLAVTFAVALIGYNFLDAEQAAMWHLLVLLVVAIIFGVLAGMVAYKFVEKLA